MLKFRHILYFLIGIPVFVILIWVFAVPDNLIQSKIEGAISGSGQGNVSASINGFKKGIFISLHADSLDLNFDKTPALSITNLTGRFDPQYLTRKQLAFSIKGTIGDGDVNGLLKYPSEGEIRIDRADLNAVTYLTGLGLKSNGHLSAVINLKDNNARITFQVPDLEVPESAVIVPFLNSFHKIQGVLSVTGNDMGLESVSLEGEKGYARLKGNIKNGVMDLSLELMPDMKKLNKIESMLILKYMVSPGYYIIPVKGPLSQ